MSIGEQLTAARLKAGLTVDEVSAATRIRAGLLTAMEADDFSRCGGNFYARGHLRTLARVLDLDPAPLIEEFDARHAPAVAAETRRPEMPDPVRGAPHRVRPRLAVLVGVALVGLLGWGLVRLLTVPSDVGATTTPTSPAPVVTTPGPTTPTARASRTPATPSRPVPPSVLRVTVVATGDGSYVTLRNLKGQRLFSGLLRGGSTHTLAYRGGIRVRLETGRNVRILVNGTRVVPESERFTVTASGQLLNGV